MMHNDDRRKGISYEVLEKIRRWLLTSKTTKLWFGHGCISSWYQRPKLQSLPLQKPPNFVLNCHYSTVSQNNPKSRWVYAYFVMPFVCMGLGFWQLYRLKWKLGLIQAQRAALEQEPIRTFETSTMDEDLKKCEEKKSVVDSFRPHIISGRFIHDQEIQVFPRMHNGQVGAHIVTPLLLSDGSKILVNRGWVPKTYSNPKMRQSGQIAGDAEVIGSFRSPQKKGIFTPDNNREKNQWYWIDIGELASFTGSRALMIDSFESPGNPGGLPIGGHTLRPLDNPHANYAATWFCLAAILTGMSVMIVRKHSLKPPFITSLRSLTKKRKA